MKRHHKKYIHEGSYVAEVEVTFEYPKTGWSPLLSLEDAYKLEDVREALRRGDLSTASSMAQIFSLTPVAV